MTKAAEVEVVVEKAKRRARFVVAAIGPRTFRVLDTREVDSAEHWLVASEHGTKRLANAVAKDRETRWLESGGR